jgi:hypothetical protein
MFDGHVAGENAYQAYGIRNHNTRKNIKIFLLNLDSLLYDINRKENNWLLSLDKMFIHCFFLDGQSRLDEVGS